MGTLDPTLFPARFSWRRVRPRHPHVPPGTYAGNALNQHASSWCGMCYLVAAMQMVEDRWTIQRAKGGKFGTLKLSIQTLMDHFEEQDATPEWNVCKGGFSLHVLQCMMEKRCPMVVDTTNRRSWFAFARIVSSCPTPNAEVQVLHPRRLAPKEVKQHLYTYGPVVLEINAGTLKSTDAQTGRVTDLTPQDPNHAVCVVGYDIVDGHECWIVRNSWGTYVPTDIPSDLSCVSRGSNICKVDVQPWHSAPHDHGFCFLPVAFSPLWETDPSPWVTCDVLPSAP